MAKDPFTEIGESVGKAFGGAVGEHAFETLLQEYGVEILWVALTALIFGAFFVLSHRNPETAGAITGSLWVLLLWTRPTRRVIRRTLVTSSVRRSWDRAVRDCGFKHPIKLSKVQPVVAGHQARIRVRRGIAFRDVELSREHLAASMAIRELKVRRDPHNAATGVVTLVRTDPLSDVAGTAWPGHNGRVDESPPKRRSQARTRRPDDMPPPRARYVKPKRPKPPPPGTSIWDPIPVGIDEHGETVTITMPHRNLLLGGVPGSGKSAAMSMILATAALDPSVGIWLIDGKMVELAEWEPLAETFAHQTREANFLLARLRDRMDRRYQELRQMGKRNIERSLELPLHALFVDELALFTSGTDKKLSGEFTSLLQDIVARGRAAGIIVVAATQKPEGSVVSTNLRDLFAYRWALACGTPEASDTILGRGWAARGYDASTIAPGEPGVGFLRAEEGIPARHRGFYLDDNDIRALAARAREGRKQ